MVIEQLYTNCLAEAAYYIESNGEIAIIDPLREVKPYIEKANNNNGKIKYVFETHFHADFVSGHIDLANATGAQIVYGPGADASYEVYNAADGEEFKLGSITIKALHTPGHTPESTCYLLYDESGKEYALFSGDTLFIGAVGRPDLLDGKMSKEELAGMMYDSLRNKIMPLPDDVIVYPAHGAGSQCGKGLSSETSSSLGEQKKSNYALQEMTKEEFIKVLTDDMPPPPAYFFQDARINKEGYDNIDNVINQNSKPLSIDEFKQATKDALILDTRDPNDFAERFVPNSINIGLSGTFAVWVGTLIDINQPLVLVTDSGKEEETVMRLARVGFENVVGYLEGGINKWMEAGEEIKSVGQVDMDQLKAIYEAREDVILDVRKPSETDEAHIKGALIIPLSDLEKSLDKLDTANTYTINCRSGYRSMVAASILKKNGFDKVNNVLGGFNAIRETSIPQESPIGV